VLNNPLVYIDSKGESWRRNMNGGWDWQKFCGAGDRDCVDQLAEEDSSGDVQVYGPGDASDRRTFRPNKSGYVDVSQIAKTDGAYFLFQPNVETFASPQTAVDLYNGAYDYHLAYPNDSKLSLNDIGNDDGSPLPPHSTHNLGRSIDMSYVDESGNPIHKGNLSVLLADDERMRTLVNIFKENGFNQNYSDNDVGLGTQWAPGHQNHIHIGKDLHTARCEIGPCK
jgi:hypothetical protein